jgi:thymidylate kinase
MEQPKFIAVEGLDGVGKTEVSKIISSLGYQYIKTPNGAFELAREVFDNDEVSVEERASFYAMSCIITSERIVKLLAAGERIVLDRFHYSTLAYHFFDNNNLSIKRKIQELFKVIKKPDLIIFIKGKYDLVLDRLAKRKDVLLNDRIILDETKFYSIQNAFTKFFDVPYFVLDGSEKLELIKSKIMDLTGVKNATLCWS